MPPFRIAVSMDPRLRVDDARGADGMRGQDVGRGSDARLRNGLRILAPRKILFRLMFPLREQRARIADHMQCDYIS